MKHDHPQSLHHNMDPDMSEYAEPFSFSTLPSSSASESWEDVYDWTRTCSSTMDAGSAGEASAPSADWQMREATLYRFIQDENDAGHAAINGLSVYTEESDFTTDNVRNFEAFSMQLDVLGGVDHHGPSPLGLQEGDPTTLTGYDVEYASRLEEAIPERGLGYDVDTHLEYEMQGRIRDLPAQGDHSCLDANTTTTTATTTIGGHEFGIHVDPACAIHGWQAAVAADVRRCTCMIFAME